MAGRAAQLAVELTEKGTAQVAGGLDDVSSSAKRMGDTVDAASRQAKSAGDRMDSAAGGADELASKGSQAAGAMGGLGSLVGGEFGANMERGGIALQGAADAGDLLNAALENSVVASARAKAGTIAKTVADKASAAATRVMTVAQRALNLAQRASPIGLIITGVLLLVGAIVLAYRHSAKFRAIVDGAMRVAKQGVDKAVGAFKALGPVVRLVMSVVAKVVGTYVKVYVAAFQLGYRLAKATFEAIKGAVTSAVGFITDKVAAMRDKLGSAWATIKSKGKAAFDALLAPVRTLLDLVQQLLDKITHIKLPHVDVNPFNRSAAPLLQRGGSSVTTSDTVTIQVAVQAGARAADADEFMRTVDARLRALGKTPVFAT